MTDDQDLIRAIARGDPNAMQTLYQRYGLELLNYLIGQLSNRAQAEEVLQTVMLAVWQGAHNFRGESSVRTWLYAITRRQMLNARRRRKPSPLPLYEQDAISPDDPSRRLDHQLEREALAKALDDLSPPQQEALELFFFRDLSLKDGAARAGVSVNG